MRFWDFFGKFLDRPKLGVALVGQLTELAILEGEWMMTSERQVVGDRENAKVALARPDRGPES